MQTAATFLGLSAFVVYTTWAAFQGTNFEFGPYLSPLYSPLFFGPSPHAWFGGPATPAWWPGALPFSAAFLILWAPGGFRFTCYYYRGAYYKSFWADPPGCAVGEPRSGYRGERTFPLVMQNIHRYFVYIAVIFIGLLAHDVWKALWFTDGGVTHFGVGVGTLVLALNVVLLGGYTFGCHSLRHIVGGRINAISKAPVCQKAYDGVSCLNRGHMKWAWASLCWVGFTDLYIRLCAMGTWTDLRLF
jgi:hypothetical protein